MRIKIPLYQNFLHHQYAFWTFLSRSITKFFILFCPKWKTAYHGLARLSISHLHAPCTQKIISKYALTFSCAKTFCINMPFEPFSVGLNNFFFNLPEMRFSSWDEQVTTMYLCFKFYPNCKSSTDGLVVCRLPCLDKHLSSNPVELMFCSRHSQYIFFL